MSSYKPSQVPATKIGTWLHQRCSGHIFHTLHYLN